jgi:hypothetical protein
VKNTSGINLVKTQNSDDGSNERINDITTGVNFDSIPKDQLRLDTNDDLIFEANLTSGTQTAPNARTSIMDQGDVYNHRNIQREALRLATNDH